jgi:hypothetical protein
VAPIALYPDPLIAQILMAATYPLEVVEADRWLQIPANAALKGDALTAALQQQPWDPSIRFRTLARIGSGLINTHRRMMMSTWRHRPNYRLHAPDLLRDGRGFTVPHSTQHLNGRRANVINTLFS